MKEKITELYHKYFDLIPYAVFGVLTTIANIFSYWLLAHPMHLPVMASTVISWFIAVLLAYLTNRKWVFHSEASTAGEVFREVVYFFGCRLLTAFIDWGAMYLFVEKMHFNDVWIKAIANVLVIIINYIASKFIIFKHKKVKDN